MAENTNRPVSAKQYQTPADSMERAVGTYRAPGVPVPREPELSNMVRRNSAAHTTEPASSPPHGVVSAEPTHTHPVGAVVEHKTSGQRGVVTGHRSHGYGSAVPEVTWAGEEKSWPQGVSANALRVSGSTPDDLYQYNQDATSSRPMRGSTGAQ